MTSPQTILNDALGPNSAASPHERETALRARRLTKRFGAKLAVDSVSLDVSAGQVFGLIGPNGAGKTTTFSMLAGYVRPGEGTVEILGRSPTAVDALRGRVGVLPQDAMLPSRETVGEFLVHAARLQDVPPRKAVLCAERALDEVGGRAFWRQRCGSLSHGMAKRVSLAQAFLGSPEVILLDEPTAGLDPKVAYEVRQAILAKRGRATIVLSSHNLQELEEICDAAAILDRGRIVANGPMSELTAANEEVRIKVAPGTRRGTHRGQVPVEVLREIALVKSADLDEDSLEVAVIYDRARTDAETIIGQVLMALLTNHVRISGVAKGRGLEHRLMNLSR